MTFIRKLLKAHFALKQKAEKVNSDLITFSAERSLERNIKENNLALIVSKQAEKEKVFLIENNIVPDGLSDKEIVVLALELHQKKLRKKLSGISE